VNRWTRDLAPTAIGWLGTTAGVTRDGTCIVLARFESQDAAKRNSERHEQHRWWTETERLFSGNVTFRETEDVVTWMGGGSDEAGFVQVMEGRVLDRARAAALVKEMEADIKNHRPDVLGGLTANMADGTYVDVVYPRPDRPVAVLGTARGRHACSALAVGQQQRNRAAGLDLLRAGATR
jgi:hypothetical protein